MNTHLKIALFVSRFTGIWALTLTINSGFAESRLAANRPTQSELVHQVGNGSGKIHYHRVTHSSDHNARSDAAGNNDTGPRPTPPPRL